MWKDFILAFSLLEPSVMLDVFDSGMGGCDADVASLMFESGSTFA